MPVVFVGRASESPAFMAGLSWQKVFPQGDTFGSIRLTLLAESFSEQAVHQHQVDVFTDDLAGK